ncbi:MAG: hypothetical protein HW380_2056 [Magnetococcales bacterium]|nr:hypothetical protein [Magnetococcales bacterium]
MQVWFRHPGAEANGLAEGNGNICRMGWRKGGEFARQGI